jgi:hypothetical protein
MMCAGSLFSCFVDVLPKIEGFHGVNFTTSCVLEVLIRDSAVTILVKVSENLLELIFGDEKTPMVEVVSKFMRLDSS